MTPDFYNPFSCSVVRRRGACLTLWLFFLSNNEPQRHRAHRGCIEKSVYAHLSCKAASTFGLKLANAFRVYHARPAPVERLRAGVIGSRPVGFTGLRTPPLIG